VLASRAVAEALFLAGRGLLKLPLVSNDGTQSAPRIVGDGHCFGQERAGEGKPCMERRQLLSYPLRLSK
jgi:hypothetical protein